MNNYEYITASLPVISLENGTGADFDAVVEEIRDQLSEKDNATLDILLEGWAENIGVDFYRKALNGKNSFIREYFRYDLNVRNAKVDYLNSALGRPEGLDKVELSEAEFEEKDEVDSVLARKDLIEREKGLDDLMWKKCEELAGMEIFTLNSILSFIVRMKIIDRWLKLNPETGKEYLRKLVSGLRSTYDKIKYQS